MKEVNYHKRYINKYYIPEKVQQNLYRRGFKYSFLTDGYILVFPLDAYKGIPTLQCRVTINDYTNEIKINVTTVSGEPYPPFYSCSNKGYIKYLDQICDRIDKKMKRLGFKVKNKNKNKINTIESKQIFK